MQNNYDEARDAEQKLNEAIEAIKKTIKKNRRVKVIRQNFRVLSITDKDDDEEENEEEED